MRHLNPLKSTNSVLLDRNYLTRVGRSYYESSEFRRQNLDFWPISRFGLGIMSCFMLADRVEISTRRRSGQLAPKEGLKVTFEAPGRYVVLRPLDEEREGTRVGLYATSPAGHVGDGHFDHRHHHVHRMVDPAEALHHLAVHLDVHLDIVAPNGTATIPPGAFELSDVRWFELPFMDGNVAEFQFEFEYSDTGGMKGRFRYLLPIDEDGRPSLACGVQSRFAFLIDPDGDLLLATSNYQDERLGLSLGLPDDWDTEELRGVYRDRYGRKPVTDRYEYGDGLSSDILEIVQGEFRWSQDGIAVARRLEEGEPDRGSSKDDSISPFSLLQIPGLQAADIDLRGPWRLPLNVQRTEIVEGPGTAEFRERYAELALSMWKKILLNVSEDQGLEARSSLCEQVIQRGGWFLREKLKSGLRG